MATSAPDSGIDQDSDSTQEAILQFQIDLELQNSRSDSSPTPSGSSSANGASSIDSNEPAPSTVSSDPNEPVPSTSNSVTSLKRSLSVDSVELEQDSSKILKQDPEASTLNNQHPSIANVMYPFLPSLPTGSWSSSSKVDDLSNGPTIGDTILATIDSFKELSEGNTSKFHTHLPALMLPNTFTGTKTKIEPANPILISKSRENGKDCFVDIVSKCFELGMIHILERIFLALPLRSILACNQVSKDWQKVNRMVHKSSNPRLQSIVDDKIHEEWKRKNPFVQSVILDGFIKAGDIVADDQHIFINGISAKRHQILVLDSKDISVLHALDVQCHLTRSSNEVEAIGCRRLDIQMIRLNLNKKFLVAIVVHSFGGSDMYTALVWNRAKITEKDPPLIFQRRNPGNNKTGLKTCGSKK